MGYWRTPERLTYIENVKSRFEKWVSKVEMLVFLIANDALI
jgi:hypothetical protein